MHEAITRLQQGQHHDPFEYLGRHPMEHNREIIRAFMPSAKWVEIDQYGRMTRVEGSDLFEAQLTPEDSLAIPQHYQLRWAEKHDNSVHCIYSPYSFAPQLKPFDLHLFGKGRHWHIWQHLGSHLTEIDGIPGCRFAVWAPNVRRISVVGDFNGWNGLRHPMRSLGQSGVWELFIPELHPGDAYKYEIISAHGDLLHKADPYASRMSLRPETTSRITAKTQYAWEDQDWLEARKIWDWQHAPVSIYELHLGSWRRDPAGKILDYRSLADQLVSYVCTLGYTHIELMPITEYPLDESWGYQVSAYFAPTSRYGEPDDLRYLVDRCHQHNIGVILDWVPAHFPKDDFALARFIGDPLYEHADPKRGEHQDWGTLIFDYARHEVRNLLIANAIYWIEEFHFDGVRVDAVASMLYLDYSREPGQWTPNQYGGREHLEAIDFLKEVNETLHTRFPGVLTIAEESTDWPMVTRPPYMGGLGFSMKWNMGWMHDTLEYMQQDPVYRKYNHEKLTFSQLYAWSENFILPFSHDEVVHEKGSMLSKMPGDSWQQLANLRLLYAYQYAHPGKKLLFMGSELGQWEEWDEHQAIDWPLAEEPRHRGLQQLIRQLNLLYRQLPALHYDDFSDQGFQWVDCHDHEQSILSFCRRSPEDELICIFNFTPVPRQLYRIGVPAAASYHELLNTDSSHYGGSNVGNEGSIRVQRLPWMGFDHSIELTLPPLSALFLQRAQ